MPKVFTKSVFILFGASVISAAVLRCVQSFMLTDTSTGFIEENAAGTVTAFYVLCALSVALCGIAFSNELTPSQPFDGRKSKPLFYTCLISGTAMFYDFVYQCISCYKYLARNPYIELNYFIPMLLAGIAALFCAFYFIVMGVSFVTDKYDFRRFRFLHLALVIRFLLVLFTRFTRYDDGFLAEENLLFYAVLLMGILFAIAFIGCVDGSSVWLRTLCFSGMAYAALSFILSLPRMIVFITEAQINGGEFSFVPYLFTGIFAAALVAEALKKEKIKEV